MDRSVFGPNNRRCHMPEPGSGIHKIQRATIVLCQRPPTLTSVLIRIHPPDNQPIPPPWIAPSSVTERWDYFAAGLASSSLYRRLSKCFLVLGKPTSRFTLIL